MVEIEFLYSGMKVKIQSNYSDKLVTSFQKLRSKLNINFNSVYYLFDGKQITNFNLTINEIIKNIDKLRNKMTIQIIDLIQKEENNIMIRSKQVICPKCKSIAKININNYRIRIYDCKNKHDINDISLEDYEKEQKINISKIICEECKVNNKGNSYKQTFYRCNKCKRNLCPLCKDKHKDNEIINYDDINYICEKHNYPFALYCKTCKINLFVL